MVPADRGIFLPVSRRMHPDVCRFISMIVYEGRLASDEGAGRQRIFDDSRRSLSGVHMVEVPHAGNSQSSQEEVVGIRRQINLLLGKRFRDRDGNERSLKLNDILVVAPYNLQVNALKAGLPSGARVGTVDKFQGQEAPVCIVSMTTSSGDEIPRGVDFLFSLIASMSPFQGRKFFLWSLRARVYWKSPVRILPRCGWSIACVHSRNTAWV
jgi:superfamily I DNA and/or RNA helicase